jgi:hypothetical protein
MGMSKFKPASQSTDCYRSAVSYVLNIKDLISKNVYKFCK